MPEVDRHFIQKVRIFEIYQHAKVYAYTQRYPQFLLQFTFCFGYHLPDKEIGCCGEDQEQKPKAACFIIKIQREKNHIDYSRSLVIPQGIIYNVKADKQEQK
jgi:hypothetical protein